MFVPRKIIFALLSLALVSGLISEMPAYAIHGYFVNGDAVPSRDNIFKKFLIGFDRERLDPKGMIENFGGNVTADFAPFVPVIAAELPERFAEVLKKHSAIQYVEEDAVAYALGHSSPASTEYANSWGVDHIEADWVHLNGKKMGEGVKIAVIDTGIDYRHPDLEDNYAGGYDFVNRDSNPMDDNNHGTHVAGTIAASKDGSGVVGVAPLVDLYALKVLGRDGSGSYSNIISALKWSADNDMDIASMSLGGSSSSSALADAIESAYDSGVLLVAAAGNSGRSTMLYPAAYTEVIAVSATDKSDALSSFSNYGSKIELAAPGVSIKSTVRNGGYGTASGTSMATPHVSGVAALIMSNGIAETNSDVRAVLQQTATDLGASGRDNKYGYGLVNARGVGDDPLPPELPPEGDMTPPSQVTGLSVDAASTSRLDLSWSENNDPDLDHYNVYRGTTSGFAVTPGQSSPAAQVSANSFSDTGLAESAAYYYRVAAVDEAGNIGPLSAEAAGTTLADNEEESDATSPAVRITNPSNRAILRSSTFTIQGTSADSGSGVSTVEVKIEDSPQFVTAVPKSPGDWSTWSIAVKVDGSGSYDITARAVDNEGNVGLHAIKVYVFAR